MDTQVTIAEAMRIALQHEQASRLAEAEGIYRNILAQQPNHGDALVALGTLAARGQPGAAVDLIRQAIALHPDWPDGHFNLGHVLQAQGRLEEALDAYRRTLALKPDAAEAAYNIANLLQRLGRLDEALGAYGRTITLQPRWPEAHCNLGNVYKDLGRMDEAIAACRHALTLRPDYAEAHSNLLLMLNYHPAYDAGAIARELQRWNTQHAEPLRKFIEPHTNVRQPGRRLRIGYVSADFRAHPVAANLVRPLAAHNHKHFEIFCYSNVRRPDEVTQRLAGGADVWRATADLSDEALARQIRADGIDVLVDLGLHTARHRLLMFARKPAPVQVTFAGYPGSTGLSAIDYRLSDPHLDTPQSVWSEKTERLPDSFWCYDPLGADVSVHALPVTTNGFITFGCLNNLCKINPPTLALWAQVLRAVPKSRLLMLGGAPHLLAALEREGVAPGRVELVARQARNDYLKVYHRIDIGLDTSPYNGHTTSLDSFWMGVPVITLVGQTPVARAGLCQAMNLGLPELAAMTPEIYVRTATALAKDRRRLHTLRATLRGRMELSPLMDGPRFARSLEVAYRRMWRAWCATTR